METNNSIDFIGPRIFFALHGSAEKSVCDGVRQIKDYRMQTIFYITLAFFMGIILAIYLPMNSAASEYLGSPITVNLSFFMVAFLISVLILAFFGDYKTIFKFKDVPLYLYLTGVGAACMILGTTFLIPRIGARKFFILVVAGQILMAMVISHFGVLGSPKDVISSKKIIGAILLLIGAVISV